jgi:hypothetical protein
MLTLMVELADAERAAPQLVAGRDAVATVVFFPLRRI